jgi:hypothetical protein
LSIYPKTDIKDGGLIMYCYDSTGDRHGHGRDMICIGMSRYAGD